MQQQAHGIGLRPLLIGNKAFAGQVRVHVDERAVEQALKALFQGLEGNTAVHADLQVGPNIVYGIQLVVFDNALHHEL